MKFIDKYNTENIGKLIIFLILVFIAKPRIEYFLASSEKNAK